MALSYSTNISMPFLSIEEIYKQRKPNEKVAFLLRHAERRHILKTDPGFGAFVPLSEHGEEEACKAGRDLSVFKGSTFYASSPVFRCVETAFLIGKTRGDLKSTEIEKVEKIQRLADYYIADFKIYEQLLLSGFYPAICRYIKDGEAVGFLPLRETSEQFLEEILKRSISDINLFLTHDAWIVPFLSNFTDVRFSENNWLNFLSGGAVFFDESKKVRTILPVKFLSDGYLHF